MSFRFLASWLILASCAALGIWRDSAATELDPFAGVSCGATALAGPLAPTKPLLRVGFGEADVTPVVGAKPVYLAGFGKNRKATGIHDPLLARALVLADGKTKIALVSVDVVGLFLPFVEAVRQRLDGFTHVLVTSTHNHEGPDTLGLWGPNSLQSGVDADVMKKVADGIVAAVGKADGSLRPVDAAIGTHAAPELLHDPREPFVKHDELVALRFVHEGATAGIVVQWNCHPETLGSGNTLVSADYVFATVAHLKEKHRCPVVYLTGTVGGLMTSLRVPIKDDQGNDLKDGTFAKTERYGRLLGAAADKALAAAKPVRLVPLEVKTRSVFLPMENTFYQLAWKLGMLDRQAYAWTGDSRDAAPVARAAAGQGRLAIRSEIGHLKLGELEIAAIPGEIYPELVLGKVQDPVDKGADFPNAAAEPGIYAQLKGKHRMLIGLANDELGYIIPKRQWDEKPPFCYGRPKKQYGEENSLGPETAPILCAAFRDLAAK